MIIFNKDTERSRKDRAQDVRIDSLQTAVDELNADIAEIEITVENLSQNIDDKYAAQTQALMSELNSRIQSLISNLEDFVNTSQVNADVGNFKNLYATVLSNLKNLTVDLASVTGSASIAAAIITSEEVTSSQIQTLQATTATISELTVTLLHLANISATNITAEKVTADEVETDLLKADEARADVVKAKNITGKGWQTPIGTPDNTELLKITIPHYEGVIQLVTEDNEFSVTVFDNALIAWSEGAEYLFRVQRTSDSTELYLQNIGDTVIYQLVFIGSADTVTSTSEIVDKTGIRQNVLTLNGVHGFTEGGSGAGSSIVFVDTIPAEGEEGVIYVNANSGAWVWNEETSTMIPTTGADLRTAVQNNATHIGTLSNLTTTEKTNLVGAVNEVESHADTNTANIGTLSNLTTTAKTSLVSAINEVDSNADTNTDAIATINGNDTGLSMREVAQDVTSNLYIPCGSVAFANLPALSGLRVGSVYDVTDSFTTTSDFIEGAGHVIPAGSNIAVVDYNNVKKWDVLGSMVDLSAYYTKTQTNALLDEKTDLSVVAPEFSDATSYAVGDYVTYDGKLYKCTTAHSAGAWSSSDFTEKTVAELANNPGLYLEKSNPVGTGSFSMNRKANTIIAPYSHAEGRDTTATGEVSHAEGDNTVAFTGAQHVQGMYNVIDNYGIYADIVGGGTEFARKNIEATTWTGDKRLKGNAYVGCNDDSTGGDKLARENMIAPAFSASTSYSVGDYVIYNGELYKCTTAHSAGAWDSSHFTQSTVVAISANPTGMITAFGGTSAPAGWLICDGSAVSRTTYADLFSVIGTSFGSGDGSTTFNVPDLRESTTKGIGENPNGASHVKSGGLALGEFIDDRIQSHTHFAHYGIVANLQGSGYAIATTTFYNQGSFDTGNNNGRYGATTEVKAIGVNYIIKY